MRRGLIGAPVDRKRPGSAVRQKVVGLLSTSFPTFVAEFKFAKSGRAIGRLSKVNPVLIAELNVVPAWL
jgi:hypothetical protein